MEYTIYYDKDADINVLNGKKIGVIGYGIQGRAQALNLRDSGCEVHIANRSDNYIDQAKEDGFSIYDMDDIAAKSDILFLLIPDQAQKEIYEKHIKHKLKDNGLLVFAHGYALRFKEIVPSPSHDIGLLAPRMPGKQLREYYLNGSGVPAFIDTFQDASGIAKEKLLALAKSIGFTKAGVLQVPAGVEAELDLFIEQYLIPVIINTICVSFEELTKTHDYPAIPALSELYASGELGEVLMQAAKVGIGRSFQENASPTCQFGITNSYNKVLVGNEQRKIIADVVTGIRDGSFAKKLQIEGSNNYPEVKKLWERVEGNNLMDTQKVINKIFKQ